MGRTWTEAPSRTRSRSRGWPAGRAAAASAAARAPPVPAARRGGGGRAAGVEAVQRLPQAFATHGFQQVVTGMGLEGRARDRGRAEDHGRRRAQQFQDLEAGQLRHLYIQEEQVGPEFSAALHGLEAVLAFGHDLDVGVRLQVLADQRAGRSFVVHQDHAGAIVHAASPVGAVVKGR